MTAKDTPDTETSLSDEELVMAALQGDNRAFSLIYKRHAPALSRRLRRVLRHPQDVEDVLQITFLEAHRSLERHDPRKSFSGWLHRIAFHRAVGRIRSKKRRRWTLRQTRTERAAAELPSSEQTSIDRQLADRLYVQLQRLPPKKQVAFCLHYLDGLGFTEIGEMVGASPQTVWARVKSARDELQKHYEETLEFDASGEEEP